MANQNPNNAERRPKRRKAKYNPYNIYTKQGDSGEIRYFVSFFDSQGIWNDLEVTEQQFEYLNRCELEDIAYMNEVDRHYAQGDLTEEEIYSRVAAPTLSLEELVLQKMIMEELSRAMCSLPQTQRRRFSLYYFDGLTYEQIALMEGCSIPAVCYSIKAAKNFLKNFLKQA